LGFYVKTSFVKVHVLVVGLASMANANAQLGILGMTVLRSAANIVLVVKTANV
jgi:hypothetical protein